MDFKKTNAVNTTITRDLRDIENKAGNIYEAIVILSKRSNQISKEMKEELVSKLSDFASSTDNLEEIFENREQIEISKFYEKLPKPVSIAIQELLEEGIYFRRPSEEVNS
jgi:DNA-directed RNA polymerase subunit K/omega